MKDILSILRPLFFILLAIGIFDALIQWSDYRQWRKERRESDDANE